MAGGRRPARYTGSCGGGVSAVDIAHAHSKESDMRIGDMGIRPSRRVAESLTRVLWWMLALTAAYSVASDPGTLLAVGTG